ncbi:hypothetical protein DAMA08_026610 [Martiniozyma asiatica (nom. inval.)]|nr:hypothetical protein DAMA08_026610 [Martiniozyma asiatica]
MSLVELTKRRRQVQDLDLDAYLRLKSSILTDPTLDAQVLKLAHHRVVQSHLVHQRQLANIKDRPKIHEYLMEELQKSQFINKTLENHLEQLLHHLQHLHKLSSTIREYFQDRKSIRLTEKEVSTLFEDWQPAGRLNNGVWEFEGEGFSLSLTQLDERLNGRIGEVEQLKVKVAQRKSQWKNLSDAVVKGLENVSSLLNE